MTHFRCTDWAVEQTAGSPEAKALLLALAIENDKGEACVNAARLGELAEIKFGAQVRAALKTLLHRELIEEIGQDGPFVTYAPKGWQE